MVNSVETAQAHVHSLWDAEREYVSQLETAVNDLETAENANLKDVSLEDTINLVTHTRTKIDVLRRAITANRQERIAAIKAEYVAQGDDLLRLAETLKAECDVRSQKTQELLQALFDHENMKYVAVGYNPTFSGNTENAPRTEKLRVEAERMTRRAYDVQQQRVVTSGAMQFRSLEEVQEWQANASAYDFLPLYVDIVAVLKPEIDRITAHVKGQIGKFGAAHMHSASIAIELAWVDGTLDTKRSRVRYNEPQLPPSPALSDYIREYRLGV